MTLIATPRRTREPHLSAHDLALVVRRVASTPQLWRPLLATTTTWSALPGPPGVDVRLLVWPSSRSTELHHHGSSAAAFAVLDGALTEVRDDDVLGTWSTLLQAPAVRVIEPGIVHSLRNDQPGPAVSIHAYAPRLGHSVPDVAGGLIDGCPV